MYKQLTQFLKRLEWYTLLNLIIVAKKINCSDIVSDKK